MNLILDELIAYTAWERQEWYQWLVQQGDEVLKVSVGPHGDGRFTTVGDLVRHVFSAEKRYVERLSGLPLTDTASIRNDSVGALFQFGQQSRRELENFRDTFPVQKWDVLQEYNLGIVVVTATPRKIVAHVILHEIRHWAQIATLLRLSGLSCGLHDFLLSPIMTPQVIPEG